MNGKVFWGVIGVIIIGFGALFFMSQKSDKTIRRDDVKSIVGLQEIDIKDKSHTQEPVKYPQKPPIGGNHSPVWAACDQKSYDEPLQDEMAVHSLEHGAVWITYLPTIKASDIAIIKNKVKTSAATFSSPYPTQKSPIVLSAWGKQLEVSDVNDARIDQFLIKFRKGPQSPEPGATCSDPRG